MKYEIVELGKKTVVGVTARTKNSDENMSAAIGALWTELYQTSLYSDISNKLNDKSLGIYSDYESDVNSEYSVTVGCEVEKAENIPEQAVIKIIPKGKYAKFTICGPMETVVSDFWKEFWEMDLDRNYLCDFEEYQNADMENTEVHIYISVNG